MKKVNWSNILKLILLIGSLLISIYTIFIFIVNGLSWFGIYLLIISCSTVGSIILDFKEQIEKMPATRTSRHQAKRYAYK